MSCCNNNKKGFFDNSLLDAGKSIVKYITDDSYDAFVSESEKESRMKICHECEQFDIFLNLKRCKICLCFLDAKTKLKDQSCPHPTGNKWLKK